jgi:hypothetical protein
MTDAAITIRRGERFYGPYSVEEIRGMLNAGSVAYEDEAWSETAGKWSTLLNILAQSPEPLNGLVNETLLTAADVLGVQPEPDPAAEKAFAQRRDRVAGILSAVGLVAIALGTIDWALHMKGTAKSSAHQAASPASMPPDISNSTGDAEETENGNPPH